MVVVNYYIDRNSLFLQPLLWIFVTVTFDGCRDIYLDRYDIIQLHTGFVCHAQHLDKFGHVVGSIQPGIQSSPQKPVIFLIYLHSLPQHF